MRCNKSPLRPRRSDNSSLFSCPRAINACLPRYVNPRLVLMITACIMLPLATILSPSQLYNNSALAHVRKMPKIFLHIGAHKTATTYIQSKMVRSKEFLLQRGVILPSICSSDTEAPTYRFYEVPKYLQGTKFAKSKYCSENPFDELNRTLNSIHRDNVSQNIFISSEEYDNLNDEMVAEVAKLFSNFQTTVVVYYRRKKEHLVSYYSEFAKRGNPLTLPLPLGDFLWNVMAKVNPEADVSDPLPSVPTAGGHIPINGLCYNRVLETYSRHFDPKNVVIVHYDGVVDAEKDPWEVLLQEVMMLGMDKEATAEKGDKWSLQQATRPTKINGSLRPFSYSAAVIFYRWRWGNLTDQTNWTTTVTASPLPATQPTQVKNIIRLPDAECVSRFLKPLEDLLPKQCFDSTALTSLWEAQERQKLNEMAKKGSRLLYFEWAKDAAGDMRVIFKDLNSSLPCQVHMEQLLKEHGADVFRTIPSRFLSTFQQVAAKVDENCKYTQRITFRKS
ncbi:hypothetical protein Naga_100167g8 [Nannochloropsis gaditana]|uniref:Uncharacterized protein n=1 Tax=Nannochloropsis gaditana TaxID=72520 RepID=W7T0K7_9STRA|nr:hypothetical protein Naga_100167g8 [Nannochloropsis gaditana]